MTKWYIKCNHCVAVSELSIITTKHNLVLACQWISCQSLIWSRSQTILSELNNIFSNYKFMLSSTYKIFKGRVCSFHCIHPNHSFFFKMHLRWMRIWFVLRFKQQRLFISVSLIAYGEVKVHHMFQNQCQADTIDIYKHTTSCEPNLSGSRKLASKDCEVESRNSIQIQITPHWGYWHSSPPQCHRVFVSNRTQKHQLIICVPW